MPHKRMTKEEKHWQAESDANALARAQEIQNDKSRMVAAKKIASTEVKELQERTRAMQKVANRKTPTVSKPAARKVNSVKKTTAKSKASGRAASRGGRRK